MAFGIPKRIYTDNGREFSSIHNVCTKWNVELAAMSPARIPHKGQIEQFFQQLDTQLIRHQPGYARSQRQTEQRPARTKRLSFAELETEIEHFIQQWNDKQGAQE